MDRVLRIPLALSLVWAWASLCWMPRAWCEAAVRPSCHLEGGSAPASKRCCGEGTMVLKAVDGTFNAFARLGRTLVSGLAAEGPSVLEPPRCPLCLLPALAAPVYRVLFEFFSPSRSPPA